MLVVVAQNNIISRFDKRTNASVVCTHSEVFANYVAWTVLKIDYIAYRVVKLLLL